MYLGTSMFCYFYFFIMKKIKNNLFNLGITLSLILGIAFGLLPEKAKASEGVLLYCYAASAGQEQGAYFRDCSPECPLQMNVKPYGPEHICRTSGNQQ